MYYRPKLANGKLVKSVWPLYACRLLNGIYWPLEDNVVFSGWILDRVYWVLGILVFMGHNDAEFRYLYQNFNNIDELLEGMPTYLVLVEIIIRANPLGLRKEKLKALLKQFYAEIYIDQAESPKQYRYILMKLRPTFVVSGLYFSTLFVYIFVAASNIIFNRREPIYKMTFFFDHTPLYFYYPIVFLNIWVGIIVATILIAELNIISEMLLHLNGRFLLIREDIENCAERLLKESHPACIAKDFQNEMKGFIIRTVELYEFAAKVQKEFSFRIFVWLAFSAGLLCALGFKVYTNPSKGITFASWSCAKILELTSVGEVGSTFAKTTDEVSSMFYHSKWELIIERSSNRRENVRLMKLILNAMQTSHKPILLSGLNFFDVSLNVVITILQGAGSYFTCLISLR